MQSESLSAARLAGVGSTAARASITAGATLGALAVILGAFAAHALRARLAPEALAIFDTGARYQLVHAVALVAIGLLQAIWPSRMTVAAACCVGAGVLLFSGSLYALALGAPRALGMVTPLGGLLLISGWMMTAVAAWRAVPATKRQRS
ncbi:MAG: DUF423 domain-containing protein [Betaproteobacteria bacterium]|nr:DUF423 domain-containing protein [Betaproteobacteria bacterium]